MRKNIWWRLLNVSIMLNILWTPKIEKCTSLKYFETISEYDEKR